MDGQPKPVKAQLALSHALQQIRDLPEFGYEAGLGTQTFALLTEALAAICAAPVEEIRRQYAPRRAAARGAADKKRLDWLHDRLMQMPSTYTDVLGLPSKWVDLRDAIDRTMAKEGGDDRG